MNTPHSFQLHLVLTAFSVAMLATVAQADDPEQMLAEAEQARVSLEAFIEKMDAKYGTDNSSSNARATVAKLGAIRPLEALPKRFIQENPNTSYRLPDYAGQFTVNAGDRLHRLWNGTYAFHWPAWYWVDANDEPLVGPEVKAIAPRVYLRQHLSDLIRSMVKLKGFIARNQGEQTALSLDALKSSLKTLEDKQAEIEAIFDTALLPACGEVAVLKLKVGQAKARHLTMLQLDKGRSLKREARDAYNREHDRLPSAALRIFAPSLQRLRSAVATPIPISLRAVEIKIIAAEPSLKAVDTIALGEDFRVEISFAQAPDKSTIPFTVSGPSSPALNLEANPLNGSKERFRSEPIRVRHPDHDRDEKHIKALPQDLIGVWLKEGGRAVVSVASQNLVTKVKIDYDRRDWVLPKLREKLKQAQQERSEAFQKLGQAGRELDTARAVLGKLQDELAELDQGIRETQKTVMLEPDKALRDRREYKSYLNMKQEADRLRDRLDTIGSQIQSLNPGPDTQQILQLAEAQNRIEQDLKDLNRRLKLLEKTLGISNKIADMAAETQNLEKARQKKYKKAQTAYLDLIPFDTAFEVAYKNLQIADAELVAAAAALEDEIWRGTPLIQRVLVMGDRLYYDGRNQSPDELEKLNEALALARAHLLRMQGLSDDSLELFRQRQSESILAGKELYHSIYTSAAAQLGIEAADIIYNTATSEAGPLYGLLAELSKKAVDVHLYGDPLIGDAGQTKEQIKKEYEHWLQSFTPLDGLETTGKTVLKAGATDPLIESGVTAAEAGFKATWSNYLKERHSRIGLSGLFAKARDIDTDDLLMRYRKVEQLDATYRQSLDTLSSLKDKVPTNWSDLKASLKKNFGNKKFAKELSLEIGKEVGLDALKSWVANATEGEALHSLVKAEYAAKSAAMLNCTMISLYNEALAAYEAIRAKRDRLAADYEAEAHLKTFTREPFSTGEKLQIILADELAEGRELEVKLGGRPATFARHSAVMVEDEMLSTAVFLLAAEDLETDSDGGVTLEIAVKR